jgi:hypothetical protein
MESLQGTTRRSFIAGAAKSFLGASLLPVLPVHGSGLRAKRVIHLCMEGGMSHLDTFDPKAGVRSIPTNVEGISISEHLPRLASRMEKITLIRSMSHEYRSHGAARNAFGFGVTFSEKITIGDWDTHTDNHRRIAQPCAILDRTLSDLLDDLDRRGTLSDTLVVLTTEFGRSARLNAFGGREHHPQAFTCLLAGGGLPGGRVIGASSEDGMEVVGEKVSPGDLCAMIYGRVVLPKRPTLCAQPNPGSLSHLLRR